MKYFLFSIFIFFIFPISTLAQTKTNISGQVINSKTNETLPFVNIIYNEKGEGTSTNINGNFTKIIKM